MAEEAQVVEASNEIKFSEEELKELGELQTSYQEKQAQLGQIAVQKILLNQQVEDIKLLPLQIDEIENLSCFAKSDKEIFEFDNNLEIILEKLIQNYINATVLHVCSNSLTCEHSARMLAMDSATKNSDKMLKELNLLYNRNRQAIITKELIEIISGAEATN